MSVVVYAQDRSGRRDDGYYTKPDIDSALNIFFAPDGDENFSDEDGESPISREDAAALFLQERRVIFYNSDGEKVVIALDSANQA